MATTLDAIQLPESLVWRDEYDWSNVSQSVKKTLTGSLVIEESHQTKGRIITLSGTVDSAWIDKATLDLVMAKANSASTVMSLSFNGTAYNVMFHRTGTASPVKAKQIYDLSDPTTEHIYSISMQFIEV